MPETINPRGTRNFEQAVPDLRDLPVNKELNNTKISNETDYGSISDIVMVDDEGRGHDTEGRFLSKKNMDVIDANAERIREGEKKLKQIISEDGYRKIGEAVSKRVDELTEEGMSEADAHAKAHDEFWRIADPDGPAPFTDYSVFKPKGEQVDGNGSGNEGNGNENEGGNGTGNEGNGNENEGGNGTGNEGNGNENEGGGDDIPPTPPPGPPTPPPGPNNEEQSAEELQNATAELEASIHNFAQARIEREKLFGGGSAEKRLLEREGQILQESFRKYTEAISKDYAARSENIEDAFEGQKESLQRDAAELTNTRALAAQKLSTLQETLDTTTDPAEKAKIQIDMLAYQALDAQTQAELANIQAELQQIDADKAVELQRLEDEKNERVSEALIEVEQRVNAEMLEIREQKRPKLAKLNEWLRRKPGVRIAIGAGLAAMGVVGVVTGAVPLVALAMGGKAIMAGAGGYNLARGIGEKIADRGYEKANVDSIEDYVEAAGKQSNTRRKSKKAGVVAGAALAAIPIARGVNTILDAQPGPPSAPPVDVQPGPPSDYNPDMYRMAGIASERPSATSEFGELISSQDSNPGLMPAKMAEALLDNAYNRVTPGMSLDELKNLDAVIGRLSTVQSNSVTATILPSLAEDIKSGMSANEIISSMKLGPPIPGL